MRQTILVLLLVIAVAVSAFMWYGLRGQESGRGVASSVNNPEVAEFRRLLAALKVIELDTEFFNDPAYKSLIDSRVFISRPSVHGRSNPFVLLRAEVVSPTR